MRTLFSCMNQNDWEYLESKFWTFENLKFKFQDEILRSKIVLHFNVSKKSWEKPLESIKKS